MKVFEFSYERDGVTLKAPGISQTEMKRESLYFAAMTIDEVFAATGDRRADPECGAFLYREVLPMVTVIPPTSSEAGESNG